MWMWRWRQRKRKRAKRREDEGVREGDVERRMGREGEQVGVCPCAGTTDCTVSYRATSRNHPSLLPFSIPYSFDSPSTSTLSSYIRLFHVFFLFLFSLLFLSLRFSVYIFLACSSLPVLLSVLSLLCPPMMQPADSLPPSFRKFRVLIIPPCFLCPLARILANVLEHISRGGRNRARLPWKASKTLDYRQRLMNDTRNTFYVRIVIFRRKIWSALRKTWEIISNLHSHYFQTVRGHVLHFNEGPWSLGFSYFGKYRMTVRRYTRCSTLKRE